MGTRWKFGEEVSSVDFINLKKDVNNKQNIITDILNVFNGEIKYFKTKNLAIEFINFWNLKEGVDFSFPINGNYLLVGENAMIAGSNLLKNSDFPSFKISVLNSYGSPIQMTEAGTGSPIASLVPYSGVGKNNREMYVEYKSINQTEFKPKYTEIYFIVFLKKIFKIK